MSHVVETASGRVEGAEEHGVRVFRGIPFAAPPVGRRRFRAPEPVTPWAGVRPALAFGPMAPQNLGPIGTILGGADARQDEDCLYLNVWTPGTGGTPRPVLVWIHGGAFTIGAGSQGIYDGTRLARRGDVVVVSFNYRLGALGRLDLASVAGGLDTTANAALLDQLAALRWVQANVAAFGGDPGCVTIFGESAGAMSVSALLGTPAARGLFHRAISQSGALNFVSTADRGASIAARFLAEVGFGAGDVARLWDVPVARLLAAQQSGFSRLGDGLPFQPIVDGDVLPVHPLDAVTDGTAADVPLLVGTNLDEMKLFGLFDPAFSTLDAAGLARRCERVLPGGHAERVVAVYEAARAARGESVRPPALWYAIDADRMFRHPAMRLAERHAAHQPATYAYLFTWPSPLLGGRLGAAHAVELPFVFGTLDDPMIGQLSGRGPDADHLARGMQEAWLSFAHAGRPRTPLVATWPRYDAARRTTLVLGKACGVEDAPREPERRFWDDVA